MCGKAPQFVMIDWSLKIKDPTYSGDFIMWRVCPSYKTINNLICSVSANVLLSDVPAGKNDTFMNFLKQCHWSHLVSASWEELILQQFCPWLGLLSENLLTESGTGGKHYITRQKAGFQICYWLKMVKNHKLLSGINLKSSKTGTEKLT